MTKSNLLSKRDGLATLLRPRFSAGLLLEDDDLTAAVNYTRDMMRLMLRSLYGCGVVCGLDVKARLTCQGRNVEVTVERGVALDCLGNPIEIPKAQTFEFDAECDPLPTKVYVTVCYAEKCCRPRDISCSPDEDSRVVRTRSQDGFEIKLYRDRPGCVCSCEPIEEGDKAPRHDCCDDDDDDGAVTTTTKRERCDCYNDHLAGKCGCECDCACCVLLGIVDTTKTIVNGQSTDRKGITVQPLWVDTAVRRRIRPVLIGWFQDCYKPPKDADEPAQYSGAQSKIAAAGATQVGARRSVTKPSATGAPAP